MNFKRECLYCGEPGNSAQYSCNCEKGGWTRQYRVLDIDMAFGVNRKLIANSFHNYSFNHPEGFLQYGGLPFRHVLMNVKKAVGLTPMCELSNLSTEYNFKIYLKDEGANPSGCFKDRETVMCLLNSIYNNRKKAVIYSSGNAAASAAYFAERSGHKLIAFVAGDTYPEKIEYIQEHGADVICIGDGATSFEDGYRLFSELNENKTFANNGYDNWSVRNPFRVQGDKTIAVEIVKQLSEGCEKIYVPDYVVVPTANGSCLAGIWKGFKELQHAGIIPELPKIISVGMKGASPVCKAVRMSKINEPVRCDLSGLSQTDETVGSTIVAEEGYDSIEAARAVISSGGFEIELTAEDIQKALTQYLEKEKATVIDKNVLPEPASLTSLASLATLKNEVSPASSESVVAISTGNAQKAESALLSLLENRKDLHHQIHSVIEHQQNKDNSLVPRGQAIQVEPDIKSITNSFIKLQGHIKNA